MTPQAQPPPEIRFLLIPAYRPWEDLPAPAWSQSPIRAEVPARKLGTSRFEIHLETRRHWVGPFADALIWFGLNLVAKGHTAPGSTWNNGPGTPHFQWTESRPTVGK